jgi:succinoglycan biosynthesis transport protein ExoP
MKDELGRIDSRAANALEYARKNESNLRTEFTKQQMAANVMADSTVQLHVLAQEAYSNRALYESLFSKLQTASLASGVHATRIDVVDKSFPAGLPSSPNYLRMVSVVAGLGLFCGTSAAFFNESLDQTVRSSTDVAELNPYTLLGNVPRLREPNPSEERYVDCELIKSPLSPFSEAFRSLRASLLLTNRSHPMRTLMVTSALANSGKTTITYNLGVAFAQQGARVLLIDGDFRRPKLHHLFGISYTPGLSDVTEDMLNEAMPYVRQHAGLPTFSLLPAGERPNLPSEFFESAVFTRLLQECATRYDYVIVDSPPILPVADASILATKVGGVIGVVRSQKTTRVALEALVGALERTGALILGLVFDDVRPSTLEAYDPYSYSKGREDNRAKTAYN